MNKFNFNQSVGFPFETDILGDIQTAYDLLNAFGFIVGNFSIISGCELTGSNVADGTVFINGELLAFKGGVQTSNVIIVEVKQSLEFEDGNSNEVKFIRHATFGTATTQYPWSDFKRGFPTKDIPEALESRAPKSIINGLITRIEALELKPSNIPIGLIALWGRPLEDIPAGWEEYVNLRGRMPLGQNPDDSDFATLGSPGGAKNVTLTKLNIPELDLTLPISEAENSGGDSRYVNATDIEFSGSKVYSKAVNKDNSATAVNILNPFRIVHFIRYKG